MDRLSGEPLFYICRYLENKDIVSLGLTCRAMNTRLLKHHVHTKAEQLQFLSVVDGQGHVTDLLNEFCSTSPQHEHYARHMVQDACDGKRGVNEINVELTELQHKQHALKQSLKSRDYSEVESLLQECTSQQRRVLRWCLQEHVLNTKHKQAWPSKPHHAKTILCILVVTAAIHFYC